MRDDNTCIYILKHARRTRSIFLGLLVGQRQGVKPGAPHNPLARSKGGISGGMGMNESTMGIHHCHLTILQLLLREKKRNLNLRTAPWGLRQVYLSMTTSSYGSCQLKLRAHCIGWLMRISTGKTFRIPREPARQRWPRTLNDNLLTSPASRIPTANGSDSHYSIRRYPKDSMSFSCPPPVGQLRISHN
ncbi:uncharacterized protein LOC107264446 [Cephus cinctus]|uniref:Uncharacterized protein LOC107264446 n=1 Tax=Cephus cinctus TaxID=211228 RepID=A0AAJ7VY34_CEPCN|nr:uncharacterized protein LOC107264446 [Cephus cinctus]